MLIYNIQIAKQESMVNSKSNALQKLIPIKPKADVKKSSVDVEEAISTYLAGIEAYRANCSVSEADTKQFKSDLGETQTSP